MEKILLNPIQNQQDNIKERELEQKIEALEHTIDLLERRIQVLEATIFYNQIAKEKLKGETENIMFIPLMHPSIYEDKKLNKNHFSFAVVRVNPDGLPITLRTERNNSNHFSKEVDVRIGTMNPTAVAISNLENSIVNTRFELEHIRRLQEKPIGVRTILPPKASEHGGTETSNENPKQKKSVVEGN